MKNQWKQPINIIIYSHLTISVVKCQIVL